MGVIGAGGITVQLQVYLGPCGVQELGLELLDVRVALETNWGEGGGGLFGGGGNGVSSIGVVNSWAS